MKKCRCGGRLFEMHGEIWCTHCPLRLSAPKKVDAPSVPPDISAWLDRNSDLKVIECLYSVSRVLDQLEPPFVVENHHEEEGQSFTIKIPCFERDPEY